MPKGCQDRYGVVRRGLPLAALLISVVTAVHAERGPVPVVLEEVRLIDPRFTVELTGTVIPVRTSTLSAEVGGLVEEVLVEEGDFVSAGQPLLKLRDRRKELELAVQMAELERAKAVQVLARLKESRQADLLKSQAAAPDAHDIATAELRQAVAEVQGNEAAAALLRDELERHWIRAPFAGVISEKMTEAGSWLAPGNSAFTLVESELVRVAFPLPQEYYPQVDPGTDVVLQFDAYPGETLHREVSRKIAVGRANARTFPVWVDVLNEDHRIAPGMSARIKLVVNERERNEVIGIPQDAVVKKPDGSELLWVAVDGDQGLRAERRVITTGRALAGYVEVVQGEVVPGDRVVVRGNENLQPGQKIVALR